MSIKNDLTEASINGYNLSSSYECCQYIPTSPNWYAFQLGVHFYLTGRSTPKDVRMGRGAKIHANDMLFHFIGIDDHHAPIIDRLQ